MQYFGGMFGRASLWQCGPWFYYGTCIKAAGFTWYNLPVINSLERVQSLWGNECLLCLKRVSSALAGSFLALCCGIVYPLAENDPADDQVPSVPRSTLHLCVALCLFYCASTEKYPMEYVLSAPKMCLVVFFHKTESNGGERVSLWIP